MDTQELYLGAQAAHQSLQWNPSSSRRAPRLKSKSEDKWAPFKGLIRDMHASGMKQKDISSFMKREYDFDATPSQYTMQFNIWGLHRYKSRPQSSRRQQDATAKGSPNESNPVVDITKDDNSGLIEADMLTDAEWVIRYAPDVPSISSFEEIQEVLHVAHFLFSARLYQDAFHLYRLVAIWGLKNDYIHLPSMDSAVVNCVRAATNQAQNMDAQRLLQYTLRRYKGKPIADNLDTLLMYSAPACAEYRQGEFAKAMLRCHNAISCAFNSQDEVDTTTRKAHQDRPKLLEFINLFRFLQEQQGGHEAEVLWDWILKNLHWLNNFCLPGYKCTTTLRQLLEWCVSKLQAKERWGIKFVSHLRWRSHWTSAPYEPLKTFEPVALFCYFWHHCVEEEKYLAYPKTPMRNWASGMQDVFGISLTEILFVMSSMINMTPVHEWSNLLVLPPFLAGALNSASALSKLSDEELAVKFLGILRDINIHGTGFEDSSSSIKVPDVRTYVWDVLRHHLNDHVKSLLTRFGLNPYANAEGPLQDTTMSLLRYGPPTLCSTPRSSISGMSSLRSIQRRIQHESNISSTGAGDQPPSSVMRRGSVTSSLLRLLGLSDSSYQTILTDRARSIHGDGAEWESSSR